MGKPTQSRTVNSWRSPRIYRCEHMTLTGLPITPGTVVVCGHGCELKAEDV